MQSLTGAYGELTISDAKKKECGVMYSYMEKEVDVLQDETLTQELEILDYLIKYEPPIARSYFAPSIDEVLPSWCMCSGCNYKK